MKEIVFTPEYRKSILELRDYLKSEFGEKTEKKVIKDIQNTVHLLADNEKLGKSVKNEFGINTDYRYIYQSHNYIFYKTDSERIYIEALFNERVDFIRKLFYPRGVSEDKTVDLE